MDNNELQSLVCNISDEFFNISFKHKAIFNYRLRTTGGRYLIKSHDIEINPHSYELYGMNELIDIIKHELCHYHLHIQGKGYMHKDLEFKELLKKVGGTRFSKQIRQQRELPFRYKLVCKKCNHIYYRKRKIDYKKFRCGKCNGKLKMIKIKL